jgi:type II secretory pathway pseudopilin PulG
MNPRPPGTPGRVRADDAGFTIVEVAVAAIILAIGALAVIGLVSATSHNNFRAEQGQVVNDRLQQEMEAIKQLPYDQLALGSLPAHSSAANDPNVRVSGAQFNVNASGTAAVEDLVYNGGTSPEAGGSVSGGTLSPGPTPFQSGSVKGNVYRYVTWERDSACDNCADRWYKHVVVAVVLDQTAPGGTRAYQEIQGNAANPNAGLSNCPAGSSGCTNPGGTDETPWTFWLTDTPCSFDTRQSLTGDHMNRNTLGVCSDGPQTGSTAGAPDLMFTQAASCVNGGCDQPQPQYDYATDVEPAQNPGQDTGLQEKIPANTVTGNQGCPDNPSSPSGLGGTPYFYLHKWLSPAIPSGFDVTLSGTGELDLWTQTINGAVHGGRICAWLFVRSGATDTYAANVDASGSHTAFAYSQSSWPSNAWTEIHVPLHLGSLPGLTSGSRLGLILGVERGGTLPGDGLQLMYDEPSFDSRLEINTRSLLPIF